MGHACHRAQHHYLTLSAVLRTVSSGALMCPACSQTDAQAGDREITLDQEARTTPYICFSRLGNYRASQQATMSTYKDDVTSIGRGLTAGTKIPMSFYYGKDIGCIVHTSTNVTIGISLPGLLGPNFPHIAQPSQRRRETQLTIPQYYWGGSSELHRGMRCPAHKRVLRPKTNPAQGDVPKSTESSMHANNADTSTRCDVFAART
jgi:hypothetical protein